MVKDYEKPERGRTKKNYARKKRRHSIIIAIIIFADNYCVSKTINSTSQVLCRVSSMISAFKLFSAVYLFAKTAKTK